MILLAIPEWYRAVLLYGVVPVLLILVIILGIIAIIMLIKSL